MPNIVPSIVQSEIKKAWFLSSRSVKSRHAWLAPWIEHVTR